MKVLVAEDEPTTAQILQGALQKAGYDVVVTRDGNEAWRALQREDAPKLAILDWMMPGMSGFEVCRKLRETHENIRTYVIFLTAKAGEEHISAALDAGADDYIAKPFNKAELLARLRAGERTVRLRQQLQHRIDEVESLLRQRALLDDKLYYQAGSSDATNAINVSQIMTREIITIGMDDDLRRVRNLFEEHGFHHLLVVEKRRIVGVISDRDLLRNVSPFIHKLAERPQDPATLNCHVHRVMTHKPVTVTSEKRVEEAARVMLEHRVSCLPVVTKDSQPVGIVTWRDLLRGLCGLTSHPLHTLAEV